MKKIEVTEEFYFAALELAKYIEDSQSEYETYIEMIEDGNDPEKSIYHQAIIVSGFGENN